MKIALTVFCLLLLSSPVYAALTDAQMDVIYSYGALSGYNRGQALEAALNVKSTVQFATYTPMPTGQTGWLVSNGVSILRPLGTATAELAAPVTKITGTAGAKVIASKGLGVLGPIATAVVIGMDLKDLYDAAVASPAEYPLLNAATQVSSVQNFANGGIDITKDTLHLVDVGDNYNWGVGDPRGITQILDSTTAAGCDYNLPQSYLAGDIFTYYFPGQASVDDGSGPSCNFNGQPHNLTGRLVIRLQSTPFTGTTSPASQSQFETAIAPINPQTLQPYEISPDLKAEIDKAMKNNESKTVMYPPSSAIKDLANSPYGTTEASKDATQNAVQTAQTNYNLNPSPENKQILDELLAQQAAQIAAQAKEDALVPPDVPSNTYDPTIEAPAKKEIPTLLQTFIGSSPLVAMVQSFTITLTDQTPIVPVGLVYGTDVNFDFTRWQAALMACGGVLLVITHGYAILVVVKGW